MDSSKELDPQQLHAALSEVMASQEEPPQPGTGSQSPSRPGSSGAGKGKQKRVGFTQENPFFDPPTGVTTPTDIETPNANDVNPLLAPPRRDRSQSPYSNNGSPQRLSHAELSAEIHKALGQEFPSKPKPAIRKGTGPAVQLPQEEQHHDEYKNYSTRRAQESAAQLAKTVQSWSRPGSRRASIDNDHDHDLETAVPANSTLAGKRKFNGFIPLDDLRKPLQEDSDDDFAPSGNTRLRRSSVQQADHIVKSYMSGGGFTYQGMQSGAPTPVEERTSFIDAGYVPKPQKYRGGILGALLKFGQAQSLDSAGAGLGGYMGSRSNVALHLDQNFSNTSTVANTPDISPPSSGTATPSRKFWGSHSRPQSTTSISELIKSSSVLAAPGGDIGPEVSDRLKKQRPQHKRTNSSNAIEKALHKILKGSKYDDRKYKIKEHIEEIIARQRYLIKLCKALMRYGAPTHRLEEYMIMSARMLEIEGSFLYIPGCMIVSFEDSSIGASEVKIVRTPQGVDLGRLRDTHEIYKDVLHDRLGVGQATARLEEVMKRKPKFKPWFLVPVYGLASACVGPFAFQARWIDLPMCFILGSIVGFLQLIAAPRSDLLNNVFEICATVITSFLARFLGSLRGGDLFCFSAMAQSSIALILPGYMVLCASLELQSKNIVSGSVRMVYAIIYSFLLGFGITIGSAIYGIIDRNATSQTECTDPLSGTWYKFMPFVPAFTMCLIVINQAKWKQAPLMVIIAFGGYLVNYFSSKHFAGNAQVSNTLGAFTIGVMANLQARLGQPVQNFTIDIWEKYLERYWHVHVRRPWKRFQNKARRFLRLTAPMASSPPIIEKPVAHTKKVGYGLAAAAMLPAIFVQVPSGLAVSGSLVSGITSANQITGNATGMTTVSSGTEAATDNMNSVAFTVGYSVVQVAIGITVGLFLSALVIYPFGKRRSGLFSF